jgi:hypothetical protein
VRSYRNAGLFLLLLVVLAAVSVALGSVLI